jgi:hypothetical protein
MSRSPWPEGFWMCRRKLARDLELRRLSPAQMALVCWVGLLTSVDERVGPPVTYGRLAGIIQVSERTIRRWLPDLRAKRLLDYEEPGRGSRTPFELRLGPELTRVRTDDRPLVRLPLSDLVSDLSSDTNSGSLAVEPAPRAALPWQPTSDTPRARSTQTEEKKKAGDSPVSHAQGLAGGPLSEEIEHELGRLLALANNSDSGSLKQLRSAASGLPISAVASVRESMAARRGEGRSVGAGYAVNALRRRRAERLE